MSRLRRTAARMALWERRWWNDQTFHSSSVCGLLRSATSTSLPSSVVALRLPRTAFACLRHPVVGVLPVVAGAPPIGRSVGSLRAKSARVRRIALALGDELLEVDVALTFHAETPLVWGLDEARRYLVQSFITIFRCFFDRGFSSPRILSFAGELTSLS